MRDQFNQWRGKAKTGSMHVGRWIRRHTVLAAVALLLTVLIAPRTSKDRFQVRVAQSWRRVWERSTSRSAA